MVSLDDQNNMLKGSEVAKLLHVHVNTLRRWSEEGRIVSYRITPRGDRRYKKSDIERFLSENNPSVENLG